jgi:trehalose synthase-fused probable maltokinase
VRNSEIPIGDHVLADLSSALPGFIAARRWYRAKTRTIQKAEIEDVVAIGYAGSQLLVIRLDYTDGNSDHYVLAITFAAGSDSDAIANYKTETGNEERVYDALSNSEFRDSLLRAIRCGSRFNGRAGELIASHTSVLEDSCKVLEPSLESFVGRAEQSNTSIIYGDRFILKLFRKIEPGINPDIEIGAFLTEQGFRHTPAVLGHLEYRSKNDGDVYAVAILQQFVRNRGDAWKYTLESLSRFFDGALAERRTAPELNSLHPMELMANRMTSEVEELFGEYVKSASLLGLRTAEMHAALADRHNPGFIPEPFTPADGQKLYEEMLGQVDIAFELLRRKRAVLTGTAADDAEALLRMEHRVTELFSSLRNHPLTAARIRLHGDYHLGQVLYTGEDFMIIDFEGEPARPLSERRGKALAMRDVAGMIRSFQYAAYAALFARGETGGARSWADFWTAWMSATYLKEYLDAANGSLFLPSGPQEQRLLFDSFLLQKALYEVAYELNNRPDWVQIPLRGILSLVS